MSSLLIDHYNPPVRIIDLVSYTTYVARVKVANKWRDLQFIVESERQIFEKFFMAKDIVMRQSEVN